MAPALADNMMTETSAPLRAVPAVNATARPAARIPDHAPVSADAGLAAALQQIASLVQVDRDASLLEEGEAADYVYRVVRGTLRTVKVLADGRCCITKFLQPGDFVGLSEREEYSFTVEAVSEAALLRYPRRRFQTLLHSDTKLMHTLFTLICGEMTAVQDRLLLLGRKSAAERLASFLLAMAERQGSRPENAGGEIIKVHLPMCRQDIADYLGLTIETVSRLISKLRAQRIIKLEGAQNLVVLRRDLLADMCEIETA